MKVYEVEAYYSGWYSVAFFDSQEKSERYVLVQKAISAKTPRAGLMEFRIMARDVL